MKTVGSNRQIAIDGGAGSGKTTVGKVLAQKLGYTFIDSGLFYRLAAYLIIENGFEKNKLKWVSVLRNANVLYSNGTIVVHGITLNDEILHSKVIDELVSPVSEIEEVRTIITNFLRKAALDKNVVMAGRDIGTVVLKDAFLKIYLTATDEERASRRFKELVSRGVNVRYSDVFKNIKERDLIDSSRIYSPLAIAKDAYVIDTTNLSVEEVIDRIDTYLEGREYALRNSSHHS
jgi:cytidylate kinase